jgi:hypothetical protein
MSRRSHKKLHTLYRLVVGKVFIASVAPLIKRRCRHPLQLTNFHHRLNRLTPQITSSHAQRPHHHRPPRSRQPIAQPRNLPLRNPPKPNILPSNQPPTRKRMNQNHQRPRPPLLHQLHPPIRQYRRHSHDPSCRRIRTVEPFADAFVHHADVADGFEIGFCVALLRAKRAAWSFMSGLP